MSLYDKELNYVDIISARWRAFLVQVALTFNSGYGRRDAQTSQGKMAIRAYHRDIETQRCSIYEAGISLLILSNPSPSGARGDRDIHQWIRWQ